MDTVSTGRRDRRTVAVKIPTSSLASALDERAFAGIFYDVSRDGQKFLMIKNEAHAGSQPAASAQPPASTSMVVVLNWEEELKTRVPAK